MNIARIDAGNIVRNVEVADQEWLDRARTLPAALLLVPYTDDNPAHIGLTYDPDTGVFEQPPAPPTADNALPEGTPDE